MFYSLFKGTLFLNSCFMVCWNVRKRSVLNKYFVYRQQHPLYRCMYGHTGQTWSYMSFRIINKVSVSLSVSNISFYHRQTTFRLVLPLPDSPHLAAIRSLDNFQLGKVPRLFFINFSSQQQCTFTPHCIVFWFASSNWVGPLSPLKRTEPELPGFRPGALGSTKPERVC